MPSPRISLANPYRITGAGSTTHLRPQEALLLWAIMARDEITREEAAEILWPHPDTMPDRWADHIWVLISRLRSKLELYGWTVVTRRNYGWRLERHADSNAGSAEEEARQAA